ncbi:hypothetical protein, partial [Acinetobacter indicus]|uniref:hypothetical protein n=1 Tax=Acinetobacter indicus TaxID=756892 RepID=UPI001C08B1D9
IWIGKPSGSGSHPDREAIWIGRLLGSGDYSDRETTWIERLVGSRAIWIEKTILKGEENGNG